jgi:uncharacterized alkaline shock family protein YloU
MSAAAVEVVLAESVVAAVSAHAARRTPGVLRVEPGLGGLVQRLAVRARHEVRAGSDDDRPADAGGVDVELDGDEADVHVFVAVQAGVPVTSCAHEVQRRVVGALVTDVGLRRVRVAVSVLDVAVGVTPSDGPSPGSGS